MECIITYGKGNRSKFHETKLHGLLNCTRAKNCTKILLHEGTKFNEKKFHQGSILHNGSFLHEIKKVLWKTLKKGKRLFYKRKKEKSYWLVRVRVNSDSKNKNKKATKKNAIKKDNDKNLKK